MEVISVLEVVESIATQVPLPAEWSAGILNRDEVPASALLHKSAKVHFPISSYRLRMDFLNGLFLSAYRDSQAAGALDCYLDQAKDGVPTWYDWGPTGWPKESSSAREAGLSMLVHMSRYFERYMQAYQFGRFDGWPKRNEMNPNEGKFATKTDVQRLGEIGFERTELIQFLKHHEIPSNLTIELPCLSEAHSGTVSTALQSEPESEVDSDSSFDNGKKHPAAPGSTTHSSNKGGHVLADFIAKGQDQAGDQRKSPRVVYAILVQMAESRSFFPLVREFVPGLGIRYLAVDEFKYYTQNALLKHLNPKARGTKKKPARKIDGGQPTSVDR